MDTEEWDKATTSSRTFRPQYASPNIAPHSQRSTGNQENPMPWATHPPFPNSTVRPIVIYPCQGPSLTQLVYMNVVHNNSPTDGLYNLSIVQDTALALPKENTSVSDEDKTDSANQKEAKLDFRVSSCHSRKDVISSSEDTQESDFISVINKNTRPVVKTHSSSHDSFASKKPIHNKMLTHGSDSQRTGSIHKKLKFVQSSRVDPTQMPSNLEMQTNTHAATLIQEKEEIRNERRKQSNRESARRLRLRKQGEYQKLQENVDLMVSEISMLKKQLMRLSEDCGELDKANKCIEEELIAIHGEDAIADLKAIRPASVDR